MNIQQQYPTQKINEASQFELQEMLNKFKQQQVSIKKFGGFVAFNIAALAGLLGVTAWYVKSNWVRKGSPRKYNPKQLTIANIMKKGSKIGFMLGGLYIAGFLIVGNYTMPIKTFKKYSQIQEALHSFQIKYDPFYQQILLFRKMKKFGLSDGLIQQIKNHLNLKKQSLVSNGKLKKQTIQYIRKSQQIFKNDLNLSKK